VLNVKIKTEAVPDRVSVAGYQWHNGSQNWASLETSNLDREPTTTRPEKDEEWQSVSYEGLISPVTKAVTEIITKDLKHLAQVRTEEVVGSATCYTGLSSNPLISAGSLIQIAGFDDILQKDDVLFVTQVVHQTEISPSDGTIAYRNTFNARLYSTSDQDKSVVQYRPPRLTPRPKIDGAIIAFIEAYRYPETVNSHEVKRDDFGRFNIVFQFDAYAATDASKVLHPVRAVQRSAGQRGSSYRAQYSGTEVGVVFIDGDPDRPFVLGAFHNGVDQDPTLNWPRSTSVNI
jgi:type VI secretion system secreted protein VgrG